MQFFIPAAESDAHAERVWIDIRQYMIGQFGNDITESRFYSIEYVENGSTMTECIGEPSSVNGEVVIVIYRTADAYLVCTANRGVAHGKPIVIGRDIVIRKTVFSLPIWPDVYEDDSLY